MGCLDVIVSRRGQVKILAVFMFVGILTAHCLLLLLYVPYFIYNKSRDFFYLAMPTWKYSTASQVGKLQAGTNN
jgi:hypothetical protein